MNFPLPRIIGIVPAGGVGLRAGTVFPKQYRELRGEPMLRWAVRALLADPRVAQVRVAVAPGDTRAGPALAGLARTVCRDCGGPTRAATVLAALRDAEAASQDWVLVHDAARPGLPPEALARLIDACLQAGEGGLLAEPVADTVKRGEADVIGTPERAEPPGMSASPVMRVSGSVSRDGLWLAQTPQMFLAGELRAALEAAVENAAVTDEASAMELAGHRPLLVPGSLRNFKVTWPEHFDLMERLLGPDIR